MVIDFVDNYDYVEYNNFYSGDQIMKLLKLTLVLTLVAFIFIQSCFSQDTSQSYSDLLKEAVIRASASHAGYNISSGGTPPFPNVERLCSKEAVPFLLDVIKNGPNWSNEDFIGSTTQKLAPHIGRCYAVLCLAATRDSQAYLVLTDLLQNGKYLYDPNIDDGTKRKYDIKQYAALGLGTLGDPNAVNLLVAAMDDPDSNVRGSSMYALTEIGNMRAIEPILKVSEKYKVEDVVIGGLLEAMTKVNFGANFNRNDKTTTFLSFPELGAIKSEDNPYMKAWHHWLNIGKKWTIQKFDEKYNEYSKVKQTRPNEKDAINYNRNKISNLGLAALPLIIHKIEKGETDLIPLVSQLSDNKIKSDATQKVVLDWWKDNKNKYTIFDYSDSQANKD